MYDRFSVDDSRESDIERYGAGHDFSTKYHIFSDYDRHYRKRSLHVLSVAMRYTRPTHTAKVDYDQQHNTLESDLADRR